MVATAARFAIRADLHVASLSGKPSAAAEDVPVENQSGGHADTDAEIGQIAGAEAVGIGIVAQCSRVGFVVEIDGQTKFFFPHRFERDVFPVERRGIGQVAGFGIHQSGEANSDAERFKVFPHAPVQCALHKLLGHGDNFTLRLRGVSLSGFFPEHISLEIHDHHDDPADVDFRTDGEAAGGGQLEQQAGSSGPLAAVFGFNHHASLQQFGHNI